jgi:hypothetical protein
MLAFETLVKCIHFFDDLEIYRLMVNKPDESDRQTFSLDDTRGSKMKMASKLMKSNFGHLKDIPAMQLSEKESKGQKHGGSCCSS